jgi:exosortase A-associated hydrolase 2
VNNLPGGAHAEAFFISGTAGDLFVTYYPPRKYDASHGAVIVFPPFAEEMNKSRRMMALQARALAARGTAVLLMDLYGTGESEGDFEEARWDIWREDMRMAASWLHSQGAARISAIGVRLGALLTMDFSRQWESRLERIVLWQPVLNGAAALTQFLRTRWASSMLDTAREMESTQELREKLRRGYSVEVSGYQLSAELFHSIEGLQLEPLVSSSSPPIHWLEVVSAERGQLPLANQRALETWRKSGVSVSAAGVQGEAFWATPEIAVVPEVIHVTTTILADRS